MTHVEISSCRVLPAKNKILVTGLVSYSDTATIQIEFLDQQESLSFAPDAGRDGNVNIANWMCEFEWPKEAWPDNASVRASWDDNAVEFNAFDLEPAIYISQAMVEHGKLKVLGWCVDRGPDDVIDVLIFGTHAGLARPVARPDITKNYPMIDDPTPGFRYLAELPDGMAGADLWVEARLRGQEGVRASASIRVCPPAGTATSARLASRAVLNPAASSAAQRALARTITPRGRKRLLVSRAFHQLWAVDEAAAAGDLRNQIVLAMVDKGEVDGPLDIRVRSGHLMRVDPVRDSVIARKFLIDGTYEQGLIATISQLVGPGDTVFDVGACYGHVAMASADFVGPSGKVVAVEPNPDMAKTLRSALKRNRMTNIVLAECALGEAPGEVELRVAPRNVGASRLAVKGITASEQEFGSLLSSLSTVSLAHENFGKAEQAEDVVTDQLLHKVNMRTLDDLVAEHGCPKLIKIDIEGAEYLCLKGAGKLLSGGFGAQPIISMEYSNLFPTFGGKREDAFNLLIGHGYTAHRLRAGKVHGGEFIEVPNADEAPDHDDLFFLPTAHDN